MESIYNYQNLPGSTERKSPTQRLKWIIVTTVLATGILGGLFVGYIVASPLVSIWGMRNAAIAKDSKRFASYIDFPVFKENLKAELNAVMMERMSQDKSMKDNPFAGLGLMIAPAIVNNMVDAMVTPQGIERMMNGQFLPTPPDAKPQPAEIKSLFSEDVGWGYESPSEFHLRMKTDESKAVTLIFYRHWLGDWKLSSIKLPPS